MYAKPDSRSRIAQDVRLGELEDLRQLVGGRGGFFTWYGVAKIVAASSETASALPRRSRGVPRGRAPHGLGLLGDALARRGAALHPLQPAARADDHQKRA